MRLLTSTDASPDRYARERLALRVAILSHLIALAGCILVALNMTGVISLPSFVHDILLVLTFPWD